MKIARRSLPAVVAGLLLLAACGGSSDGSIGGASGNVSDDGPAIGSIAGRVSELAGGTPLAGVRVALYRGDAPESVVRTSSDADGGYRFDALPLGPVYRLDYAVSGYAPETYGSVRFASDDELTLEPVRLVDTDSAGDGSLSGKVVGAVDALPLAGVSLSFRAGINARDGEILATTTTDANGDYLVSGLPYGNLTCVIVGDGLQTLYTTVQVLGNILRSDQNVAVSPRVDAGDTRIVLTWGAEPRDLDSHLTGPGAAGERPFHVDFINESVEGAMLDIDDTSSFGPETITVDASRDGVYRYSVHRYSGGSPTALSSSGARVLVIRTEGVLADFFVPRGNGDLWTVFDLIGGEILPVNTITEQRTDDDWFAPETRAAR